MKDAISATDAGNANLSSEHQKKGDARKPSDTLDRDRTSTEGQDAPKRKSSFSHNT